MESKAINLQVIAMVVGASILLITAILMMFPSLYEKLGNYIDKLTPNANKSRGPDLPVDPH